MTVTVEIPLTLPSVANLREHWAAKAKRVKAQRKATRWGLVRGLVRARVDPTSRTPYVVTLTRVSPRALDSDNLVSAFKACRDEIAAYFGVDDADPRIEWRYAQAKGKPACVRIEFEVVARKASDLDVWRRWFKESGNAEAWAKVDCIECELGRTCLKSPPCARAVAS